MSQPQKSLFQRIRDFFNNVFNPPLPPASTPSAPQHADEITAEPLTPLAPRVLVLVYDPVIDPLKNTRLTAWGIQNRGWTRVDDLLAGYIQDIDECSGGLVKYNIVQRIDVDAFPLRLNGKRFTATEYLDLYTVNQSKYKEPDDRFDYQAVIKEFNLLSRVNAREIDEVWLLTYPFSGTYESVMCGTNAFWCNGPVIENTPGRRFAIMGFSYERGVGEMEEDLGHRTESVMGRVYNCMDFVHWTYAYDRSKTPFEKAEPTKYDALQYAETNLFAKFLLYDRIAPGGAQCGNVHYAPNSQKDYEWGNSTPVATYADDWLTFPDLPRVQKIQNANAWGGGDIRGHHRWWFTRFPKAAGRLNGIRLNWWSYICNVADDEFDQLV
ncbi:MAG: hypothetical protein HDKAJFGB_00647 [Anaerolineae bacterium]|nr:hypothetical protein [Anaerolineae bacterium]